MKIIKQYFEFEYDFDGMELLKRIEKAGRTCYKSESKITNDSAKGFIKKLIQSGHESVIEHVNISIRLITDRGVTHELVRHRLVSYSQESTRYCNYSQDNFGNEITIILPIWFYDINWKDVPPPNKNNIKDIEIQFYNWYYGCYKAEYVYFQLLKLGQSPQQARTVLPNSLKTEIVTTANLREWRHILKLRTSEKAHPQMKDLMVRVLKSFKEKIPIIFDGIGETEC